MDKSLVFTNQKYKSIIRLHYLKFVSGMVALFCNSTLPDVSSNVFEKRLDFKTLFDPLLRKLNEAGDVLVHGT